MKRINWFLLLVLVLPLLSGCALQGSGPSEIKIGIIEDLSGPTAMWGEGELNGATLAIEKLNKEGGLLGKQIKLVQADFKGQVPESLNAFNRLVDQEKVIAVLGSPNSAMHIALAPVADEKKIPIVGDPMDERGTTPAPGKLYKYTFLGEPSCGDQARAIASWALNEMGLKNVAIIYDQGNPYSVSLAGPFAEYYVKNRGTIVANEPFQSGTKDFRPQLTKIKQANPEAIYITPYLQEDVLIVQQLHELGMTTQVLGTNSTFYPFAETAGKDAEGTVFPNNIALDDPRYTQYIKDYKARFGKDPVVHAWMGYDNMMILANGIKKAGKLDSTAIRDAIESGSTEVQGITTKITIDPATHRPVNMPLAILKVVNGKYQTLKIDYLPVMK